MFFNFPKKDKDKKEHKSHVYVYTDGSYIPGFEAYSGAFLVFQGTKLLHKESGVGTKAISIQNVAGELSAVMHAALWLKNNNKIGTIVYDYSGIENWLNGNWKVKNEYTEAYKRFMLPYCKEGIVKFKWVKAHNGDLGNLQADKEAKDALRQKREWITR